MRAEAEHGRVEGDGAVGEGERGVIGDFAGALGGESAVEDEGVRGVGRGPGVVEGLGRVRGGVCGGEMGD